MSACLSVIKKIQNAWIGLKIGTVTNFAMQITKIQVPSDNEGLEERVQSWRHQKLQNVWIWLKIGMVDMYIDCKNDDLMTVHKRVGQHLATVVKDE